MRGLTTSDLATLRTVPGVEDVRLASQVAGEQFLEVSTCSGDAPLASFIGQITGLGGTICSLHRATPLQGVVERVLAGAAGAAS